MIGVPRFNLATYMYCVQSEWVICRVFTRKQHPAVISNDRKLPEMEEAAVHGHGHRSPGHLLATEAADDGFDSEQESAPPVVVTETQHTSGSHIGGAQAMEGDDDHYQHRQIAHEELLTTMHHHHGSSRVVSPACWLNQHDDRLGSHYYCPALPVMQSDDADYYLPELLEYSGPLDTGGEEDCRLRAETQFTAVGSSDHIDDGLYWDIGF
jgi:hypothetical protein